MLRWLPGRQGTGYDKLPLASARWPLPFDVYLIRYREGSHVPPHTDPVADGRHYRLNIILTAAAVGGEFVCADPLFATARVKLLRPDRSVHSVTPVERWRRLVLSVGWVLPCAPAAPAQGCGR
jgi:hypothetical protein